MAKDITSAATRQISGVPCRLCSSKDFEAIFRKDGFDIVRCKSCGLEFTNSDPGPAQLKAFYSEKYFKSGGVGTSYSDYLLEEEAMVANSEKRLAKINALKPFMGRLLDVGCAAGFFLKTARSRGWDVSGVELSDYASSYAKENLKLPVQTGTLKDASFQDRSFDVVTMWDVVEHLGSPLDDLREAKRILKDDGILVLTTGDAGSLFARICGKRWHLYNPSQHLSFFSRRTIGTFLEKAGFKIIKVEKAGNCFTLTYLASSLAMYYPSILTRMLYKIASNSFLKIVKVSVNLKDIMTVYAVKECND